MSGLGRLFGIGIGPGDPDLVTMKGARILRDVSVIFGPAARKGGESIALKVAREAASSTAASTDVADDAAAGRTVALHFPMTVDRPELERSWTEAAEAIVAVLRNGEDAAFVTLGDPGVYSTFGYLAEEVARLEPGVIVERVPGVTSFSAAAAAVGETLVDGSAPLVVLPGTGADTGRLRQLLEQWPDAGIVIMKAGARLDETAATLAEAGRGGKAVMVSRLGLEGESLRALAEVAGDLSRDAADYLTLVLSPGSPGSLAAGGAVEAHVSVETPRFEAQAGVVYFVGAGPGDPTLITVKGRDVISRAGTIVFAGSLVNPDVLVARRPDAAVFDSAGMTLEETTTALVDGALRGEVVARVHTGDPAMYGAIQEQMAELDKEGVPYKVIPGVSSVFAAAAALGVQLTQPGGSQSVILTRAEGRTPVPAKEALSELARHGSTMALFLSVSMIEDVVEDLLSGYPPDTPVAVVAKASWPDERIVRGSLSDIAQKVKGAGISKTALIMVGGFLGGAKGERSKLYDPAFAHMYRSSHSGEVAEAAAELGAPVIDERVAVVALTSGGAVSAGRIAAALASGSRVGSSQGAVVYLPEGKLRLVDGSEPIPTGGAMAGIPILLRRHKKVVTVCALGIVVRALGPHLSDKNTDGAVVVADERLQHFISVLGGHIGGANRLATELAVELGGEAVVTTSSDVQGLPALDVLARDFGLVEGEPGTLRRAMSALTDGVSIGFLAETDSVARETMERLRDAGFSVQTVGAASTQEGDARYNIVVSDRGGADDERPEWLIPKGLVVGVGCKRGTPASAIIAAIEETLAASGLEQRAVVALASIDIKADEEGLIAAARDMGVPLHVVTAEAILGLEAEVVANANATAPVNETVNATTDSSPGGLVLSDSDEVRARVGVGGVCEPACLIVAGGAIGPAVERTPLLVSKTVGDGVTVAVCRAVPGRSLGGRKVGQRGLLSIVGSGPGAHDQMTPAARQAIASADIVVGYKTYLDPLGALLDGKIVRSSGMRKEVDRAVEAVRLASEGRRVAMVSGGDPGIYGMAGPVLEVLGDNALVDVEVLPGVTALSAAAAALGAPLMHDFCAISLSDLLTPWEVIEARLEAAGVSDMVVSLYNPRSQGRRTQLDRTVDILLRHRGADTPVGIVRDAGRQGQAVKVSTLAQLPAEEVDMSTTVIIGSSNTRMVGGRMVTPRGYRIGEKSVTTV